MTMYSVLSEMKMQEPTSSPGKEFKSLRLISDTREQKPLWVPPLCLKECLIVGDYTTKRLKRKFIVERKSPGDLYGTITAGHPRFKREIKRAIEHNIELVVFVECSRQRFINKNFPGGKKRKYPGTGLERILSTLEQRYDLEFVWCKNRSDARNKILKRFKKEENKL
jgi:ERCC4-type nuclease